MAYVSQEDKKNLAPAIKAVLKKYNVKASIAVRHHSTLVVNIKSSPLDIISAVNESQLDRTRLDLECNPHDCKTTAARLAQQYVQVNEYWLEENYKSDPVVLAFLLELKEAMHGPDYFCEDDSQTDYFHRSHYIDINVGSWSKPYICTDSPRDWTSEIEELKQRAEQIIESQKTAMAA